MALRKLLRGFALQYCTVPHAATRSLSWKNDKTVYVLRAYFTSRLVYHRVVTLQSVALVVGTDPTALFRRGPVTVLWSLACYSEYAVISMIAICFRSVASSKLSLTAHSY